MYNLKTVTLFYYWNVCVCVLLPKYFQIADFFQIVQLQNVVSSVAVNKVFCSGWKILTFGSILKLEIKKIACDLFCK